MTTERGNSIQMNCVGCGRRLYDVQEDGPPTIMMISCSCNAYAPITVSEDEKRTALPASLGKRALEKLEPLHIEYYLGYSDHTSELKDTALAMLRRLGCTSQADCDEAKCEEEYSKNTSEWLLNQKG